MSGKSKVKVIFVVSASVSTILVFWLAEFPDLFLLLKPFTFIGSILLIYFVAYILTLYIAVRTIPHFAQTKGNLRGMLGGALLAFLAIILLVTIFNVLIFSDTPIVFISPPALLCFSILFGLAAATGFSLNISGQKV